MSQTARKSFAVEFKTVDEAEGIVDAIVNTTGLVDRQKDIVEPGAFRKAVTGKLPKVVNSHQGADFLGKVLSMREIMPGDPSLPKSLFDKGFGAFAVKMQFNLETQAGREMFSNVKGGYVDEWSFMFTIADGQYDAKGIRHIKLIDEIFEVSPVLVGANQATLTLAAKSAGSLMDRIEKAHMLLDDLRIIHGAFKSDVSTKPKRARARFSIRTSEGPKYPINDCSDVSDAWHLRGRSSIPEERVVRHIRRAASALHCDGPWNSGKAFDPNEDCAECEEHKDGAPLPPLTGDEALHTEPFDHAIDDIKELIAQELAEEEPEADCVMELSSIWQALLNWYMGEASESESDSPMQAYSFTPDITATRELTARAIAAGIAAGRSRHR